MITLALVLLAAILLAVGSTSRRPQATEHAEERRGVRYSLPQFIPLPSTTLFGDAELQPPPSKQRDLFGSPVGAPSICNVTGVACAATDCASSGCRAARERRAA